MFLLLMATMASASLFDADLMRTMDDKVGTTTVRIAALEMKPGLIES